LQKIYLGAAKCNGKNPSKSLTFIFSIGDIAAMYNWYIGGSIANIYDFVFGLVTKDGAYILKVEDKEDCI
jgi:hypothetical protein